MTVAIIGLDVLPADLRQAAVCAMDRQTLRDWVHRYNEAGLDGLRDQQRRNGPPPRLSVEQQAELAAYLFGAVCLKRCVGAAIIMPAVRSEAMAEHLMEISSHVAPGAHAVLILDGAGWHQPGERLRVPDNISLLPLPPYAPELNT